MAVKPYTWRSWLEARGRMPEICSRWSWDREHADKAFVNVLRLRNVSYRGEAREVDLGLPGKPIRLEDVVAGLLSVTSFCGWAEYERRRWSAGMIGRLQTAPREIVTTARADLSHAELAWEEFRDKLIMYELPDGATLNPAQPEASVDQGRQRADTHTRISSTKRKQRRAYERRVKEFRKLGRAPPVQTTADGKIQGDREWAVEHCVSRPDITAWRRELVTSSKGRPRAAARNSAG